MATLDSGDRKMKPRFPDAVIVATWDWANSIPEDVTLTGSPTVESDGSFVVDQVNTVGTETTFRISGGTGPNNVAKIYLKATLSNGETVPEVLWAPIKAY
jgi:hypothetical protein